MTYGPAQPSAPFLIRAQRALAGCTAAWIMAGLPAAAAPPAPPSQPASAAGKAASSPPPIADFFRDPEMQQARLSPDGRYVAFAAIAGDDSSLLAVMDLDEGRRVQPVVILTGSALAQFDWVDNERIVYTAARDQAGRRQDYHGNGLWSVRRDGKERRSLISTVWDRRGDTAPSAFQPLSANWRYAGVIDDGSGDVLVTAGRYGPDRQLRTARLSRLNVEHRRLRTMDEGLPANTMGHWLAADGQLWAVQAQSDNKTELLLKDASGAWVSWQRGDLYDKPTARPFASDGGSLRLVLADTAEGTQALYRVDPATLKLETQPLVSLKGYDFTGEAVFDPDSKRLLGLQFETDTPANHWFDPTLRAMQAAIDRALPGRANQLECGRCLKTGRVLVSSVSDTQPTEFFVYEQKSGELIQLGSARPWIRAAEQAPRDLVRVQARDGLEFPVMVTTPRGQAGPRPTVVLVHGGPYVRGTQWAWDPLAQFLASRGYLVIEPEFRGSTGYGQKLFRAGWKQWGLAMQDDVSDALRWAVKQGLADPQRTCIAGASYGGYATLMGLIKDPAQYRCGISWVGVTDIDYLFNISWSDMTDVWKEHGMRAMVGDPVTDAEQLRNTSPVRRAAEITQPLLLAYGDRDVRVPVEHGVRFRSAVLAGGNKQVEYVLYDDEYHGWRKLSTKQDFYGRMERFLARHIGGQVGPDTAPAAR